MKSITLKPIKKVNGSINLPGSKSISNRILLLSALAKGVTTINNLLNSDDTYHMLNALRALGISYQLSKNNTCCKIIGNEGIFNTYSYLKLFSGNAGTVMRLLTATLCLGKNNIILTGEKRMKKRPINHLVDALRQGGAKIDYIKNENYPPLHLQGGFIGGIITLNCNISSQFLTALLIVAPLSLSDTTVIVKGELVSKPYIDLTLNVISSFGVFIDNQNYQKFFIQGNQQYRSPINYNVEGDASSASYFLAAAAIKGGTVKVNGINCKSIQGDIYIANILEKMGAIINWGDNFVTCTRDELEAIDMDMNHIPDIAMTIAVTALFAKGTTIIRNIFNWRVKETDRLFAMATELRKIGAIVKEGKDYIKITPQTSLCFAKINTYNDHRIAMCFSLVALSNTLVTILNPKCISKSFPDYFKLLRSICIYT